MTYLYVFRHFLLGGMDKPRVVRLRDRFLPHDIPGRNKLIGFREISNNNCNKQTQTRFKKKKCYFCLYGLNLIVKYRYI